MELIGWIAIAILVLVGFYLLKLDHHARKIKIIAIILIAILIYFSITGIFSSDNIDIKSPRGIANAVYVYFGWLGHTVSNLWDIGADTVRTVGNAIKINQTDEER